MSGVRDFADALRMERVRRRMRQGVLAEQLGVAQGVLCNWESGRNIPKDDALRQWAAVLAVPVPDGVVGVRLAPCGTPAAYQRHLRNNENLDEACRIAHAEQMRAWREARP